MRNELCIRGGLLVTPGGTIRADVGVADGVIAEIGRDVRAERTADASGLVVMPGMIDTHVHIRGGALSHREDFVTGSRAAAAGGVTTILEMPVGKPPASSADAFLRRREEVAASSVDVALYGGAGEDNLGEIPGLARLGAVAFKTFLMPAPEGREAEFYGLCADGEDALCRVMEAVRGTGRPLCVHAEDNRVVAPHTAKVMAEGGDDLEAWERSRPVEAELRAIRTALSAAGRTGCRIGVCHVSSAEGLDLIREARAGGLAVHAESCPAYLTMDWRTAGPAGALSRIKPPLRSPAVRAALAERFARGEIDVLGSDHAPYTYEEKMGGGSLWKAADGMPGLEMSMLQLLNLVSEGAVGYGRLAEASAGSAARLFGLADRGSVEVGKRADLALVRPDAEPWSPRRAELQTRSRESGGCFELLRFTHRVERTYVGGVLVYDGAFYPNAGPARFVRPAP